MSSSSGVWKLVRVGVTILLVVVGVLAWYGRKTKMGTKLQVTSKETVNYSGTATEQEAQALGKALQDGGYFDGQNERDVLFHKGDDGVTLSFVLQDGKWNDPEIVTGFEAFGSQLALAVGGAPYTLLLIDDELNTKKSLTIKAEPQTTDTAEPQTTETAEKYFKHTEQETVRYFDGVTEDDARKLGQALQTAGYFDNTAPAEVLLKIENGGFAVSFVVQDGSWDDAEIVAQYEEFGRQIAPAMGDKPLVVHMVDLSLQPHWTTTVSPVATETPAPPAP